MKTNFYIFFTVLLLSASCASFNGSSFKDELVREGDRNDLIRNAILDFSNTTGIYKRDTVFSVNTCDINEDVLVVSIGKNNIKML